MSGERILPNLGLKAFWTLGSNGYKPDLDEDLRVLSIVVQAKVLGFASSLPGSPTNGDVHILTAGVENNHLAVRDNGTWVYYIPKAGWIVWSVADSHHYYWNGSAWLDLGLIGADGASAVVKVSSATSNALASSGSKIFGYSAVVALGWAVGSRLRFYNDSTHYMEGVVTAVSSTSVTATIDRSVGTGTFASWTIGLAGDVGVGSAGPPGNTILYGTVAPTTQGVDGDFYIRTSTNFIYGPKAAGAWPSGTSLVGPGGTGGVLLYGTVAPTTQGVDGDFYLRTTTNFIYGPKASGSWPAGTSLVGPAGVDFPASNVAQKTGAYTITSADFSGNKVHECDSASNFTVTLNTGTSGTEALIIVQKGAGQISLAGSATLKSRNGLKTAGLDGIIMILPVGSNVFRVGGDTVV